MCGFKERECQAVSSRLRSLLSSLSLAVIYPAISKGGSSDDATIWLAGRSSGADTIGRMRRPSQSLSSIPASFSAQLPDFQLLDKHQAPFMRLGVWLHVFCSGLRRVQNTKRYVPCSMTAGQRCSPTQTNDTANLSSRSSTYWAAPPWWTPSLHWAPLGGGVRYALGGVAIPPHTAPGQEAALAAYSSAYIL